MEGPQDGEEQIPAEYSEAALAEEEKKMAEPGHELNMDRLKQLMEKVTESWKSNQTPIEIYTEAYFEWTKMFKHMGSAISIAFKGKSIHVADFRN